MASFMSPRQASVAGFVLGLLLSISLGWAASIGAALRSTTTVTTSFLPLAATSPAAEKHLPSSQEVAINVEATPRRIECAHSGVAASPRIVRTSKLSLRSGPMRWELGVLKGRPDLPLGSGAHCSGPSDAWQGLVGPDGRTPVQRGPGSVPESCMASIEPLNPRVPLRGTETCAQHNRRWELKADFQRHMDHNEPKLRNARVTLLAGACPAHLDAAVAQQGRRIFVDAGCRHYDSSTQWFRETYPGGKDFDVFAIDVVGRYGKEFDADGKAAFYHGAVWNETGFMSFVTRRGLEADGYFHTRWEDMPSTPIKTKLTTVPTIALGPFLRARARVEDFVVVKLDIEGAEWLVLQHLAREGALELIDEMFIECHHAEWVPAWPSQHSLADCHRMFNSLRGAGIYAHEWY